MNLSLKAVLHHPVVHAVLLASILYLLWTLTRPGTVVTWPEVAVLIVTWMLVSYIIAAFTRSDGYGTLLLCGAFASFAGAFMVLFFKFTTTPLDAELALRNAILTGVFTVLAGKVLDEFKRLL